MFCYALHVVYGQYRGVIYILLVYFFKKIYLLPVCAHIPGCACVGATHISLTNTVQHFCQGRIQMNFYLEYFSFTDFELILSELPLFSYYR